MQQMIEWEVVKDREKGFRVDLDEEMRETLTGGVAWKNGVLRRVAMREIYKAERER